MLKPRSSGAARAKVNPAQARAAAMRNLKRLHDAGVVIAAGTDAGNIGTLHASSLYAELQTMVDSGLTPKEVLVTATLNGAKHMAQEQHIGTIAAGKVADLLVLDADPTADIHNVAAINLVVKNGSVYTPGDLTNTSPMQLAQRHANAVNAHNAEALSEMYSPNAHVSDRGKTIVRRAASRHTTAITWRRTRRFTSRSRAERHTATRSSFARSSRLSPAV